VLGAADQGSDLKVFACQRCNRYLERTPVRTRNPCSIQHAAWRLKHVVNIGDGVQGLMIGDGTVQHNDFRTRPEA
jgi:hypothetical protein